SPIAISAKRAHHAPSSRSLTAAAGNVSCTRGTGFLRALAKPFAVGNPAASVLPGDDPTGGIFLSSGSSRTPPQSGPRDTRARELARFFALPLARISRRLAAIPEAINVNLPPRVLRHSW